MRESARQALEIESIFYEAVINDVVDLHTQGVSLGLSREELLYNHTILFMTQVDGPERLASLAAMMLVLLAEERLARPASAV